MFSQDPLLMEKMAEMFHGTDSAHAPPDSAETPTDPAQTAAAQGHATKRKITMEASEQDIKPSKQHRVYGAQHRHHDYDGKTHQDFLAMNEKIGTRDAVRMFATWCSRPHTAHLG